MDDRPIDLGRERAKREQPDPTHVRQDEYGQPLYRFLISYKIDGRDYGSHVWAYDLDDAQRHARGMSDGVTVDGQCFSTVEA